VNSINTTGSGAGYQLGVSARHSERPPFRRAAIFSHFQQWELTVRDSVRVRVSCLVVAISTIIPCKRPWMTVFRMADPSAWQTRTQLGTPSVQVHFISASVYFNIPLSYHPLFLPHYAASVVRGKGRCCASIQQRTGSRCVCVCVCVLTAVTSVTE